MRNIRLPKRSTNFGNLICKLTNLTEHSTACARSQKRLDLKHYKVFRQFAECLCEFAKHTHIFYREHSRLCIFKTNGCIPCCSFHLHLCVHLYPLSNISNKRRIQTITYKHSPFGNELTQHRTVNVGFCFVYTLYWPKMPHNRYKHVQTTWPVAGFRIHAPLIYRQTNKIQINNRGWLL